jgi:recombination protein RecR
MSHYLPKSIRELIIHFSKLPGIGPKTASRLTYYLLSKPPAEVGAFGQSLVNLQTNLKYCQHCHNYAESDLCSICQDARRNPEIICVVEQPLDVVALEKTGFNGVYHILHGALTPIEGIGPDHLTLDHLKQRLTKNEITELIIATNPTLEGEATAIYIQNMLPASSYKITRLAFGLPMGTDLEYADELTLAKAIEGRK